MTEPYLRPNFTDEPPLGLTLEQFIQTVLVGMTGIDGTLVRAKWQPEPPKQPDIMVNWLAFAISTTTPDANGFLGVTKTGRVQYQRHETLDISCSIYGPNAYDTMRLIRDGFQVPQNFDNLRVANMGFVEVGQGIHMPELINERWFNRFEVSVVLRRETQRFYPVLTFLSAHGTIYSTIEGGDIAIPWAAS